MIRIGGMKLLASVLCLALGVAWVRPARAEEARPNFEGLEPGPTAAETYRLNAFTIVHEEISGAFLTFNVGRKYWWRPDNWPTSAMNWPGPCSTATTRGAWSWGSGCSRAASS